jgi:hypothetical protein
VLIRKNWGEHRAWILFLVVASALSALWYVSFARAFDWEARPRGSQGPLFLFGLAGGSICLFEFLLWPRKKLRVVRIGRVQTWMRAHIWLGLLAVPLLLLHSGFYFQNLEATLLFVLFVIVILSGVWGLILQQFIPQKLLDEVPAETIYSQIDHIANLMVDEADRLVVGTCGVTTAEQARPKAVVSSQEEEEILASAAGGNHFTVGAVRVVSGVQGKVLQSQSAVGPVPGSEALRDFFNDALVDYLKRGRASGSELAVAGRAKARFDELRLKVPAEAHGAVASLEDLAEQRRQIDRQARLHFWLHNWLWVHLPISVALLLLMFVHIFVTLQYWWPS